MRNPATAETIVRVPLTPRAEVDEAVHAAAAAFDGWRRTPPTERIDNNWEYVRIAAEDAGVIPQASDSIEQLVQRMRDKNIGGPALESAAA